MNGSMAQLWEPQVAGQVQLDLYPRGIRKEFLTLPKEIVEAGFVWGKSGHQKQDR